MASVKREREYLTAITVVGGIITLIDNNGSIQYYRQRGIKKLTDKQRQMLIGIGLLQRDWERYKELPSHISISYEDPSIMGRARATYPNPEEIIKALQEANKVSSKTSNKRK